MAFADVCGTPIPRVDALLPAVRASERNDRACGAFFSAYPPLGPVNPRCAGPLLEGAANFLPRACLGAAPFRTGDRAVPPDFAVGIRVGRDADDGFVLEVRAGAPA
jgi:hypothetical protein